MGSTISDAGAEVTDARHGTRRNRSDLRRLAGDLAVAAFLRDCGRKAVKTGIGLRGGEVAGFSGLMTCGSWAACPVCAAKIGAKRSEDLTRVLDWANGQGLQVAMLTLTARHHRGQSLETLWDGLSAGWRAVTKGWGSESESAYERRLAANMERWEAYRAGVGRKPRKTPAEIVRRVGIAERAGMVGYVRVTEVTGDHGRAGNGWHCHYHVVLVLDPTGADLEAFQREVFRLWAAGLATKGLDAVEQARDGKRVGCDLRVMSEAAANLPGYLVKSSDAAAALAREATLGQFKTGRRGSMTPFEMLAAIREGSGPDCLEDRWREWVRVSRGRRQVAWSRGLADLAGIVDAEQSDEDIAAEETGGVEVAILTGDAWRLLRDTPHRFDLLETLELHGREAALALLREWRLPHVVCDAEGVPREPWGKDADRLLARLRGEQLTAEK